MEDALIYILDAISVKTEPGQPITSDILKEIIHEALDRKSKNDLAGGGY